MKKYTVIFLLFILIFSGCGLKRNVAIVTSDISFEVNSTYFGNEFSFKVLSFGDGQFKVNYIKPESIAGLTLSLSKEGVTAEFIGLEPISSTIEIFNNSPGAIIYSTLKNAGGVLANCQSDGVCTYNGMCEFGEYIITLKENGIIEKIELQSGDFVAEISNVSFIK